jgi:hypothetical protein
MAVRTLVLNQAYSESNIHLIPSHHPLRKQKMIEETKVILESVAVSMAETFAAQRKG